MKKCFLLKLLLLLLLSCKQEAEIEFHFLIDSTDKITQNTILDILDTYKSNNITIFPSNKSKILLSTENGFIEFPLFPHGSKINERNLKYLKEKIKLNDLTNSNNFSKIKESDFESYLRKISSNIFYKKYIHSIQENIKKDIVQAISLNFTYNDSGKIIILGISLGPLPYPSSPLKKGIVLTKGGNLNIRESPNINGRILFKLPNHTKIEILENGPQDNIEGKLNFWVKIKYQNNTGWAWGEYIRIRE